MGCFIGFRGFNFPLGGGGILRVPLNFFPLRECLLLIAGLRTWEIREDIGYLRFFLCRALCLESV
jgi:hypothetical protein